MIDTDGILDRCARCGARARTIMHQSKHSVECTECPNAIGLFLHDIGAMLRWNKEQRSTANTTSIAP